MKFGHVTVLLCMIAATQAFGAEGPRSIFDDDWTPPARDATPKEPASTTKPAPPTKTAPSTGRPVDAPTTTSQPPTPIEPRRVSLAVPSKIDQAAARKVLREVFADQLIDRSIPARRKLTADLLAQAENSEDAPVDRFVLLAAAVDAAVDGVDLPAAMRAADEMADVFRVDGLAVKADAALRVGPRSGIPGFAADNMAAAVELADELIRVDDYATASRVCNAFQPAATTPALRAQLQMQRREVAAVQEAAEQSARHLTKLKESPDDPALNLAAGRHICLVAGDWSRGLPLLAKGSDVTLKNQALRELAQPATPEAIARVGDGWWDTAAKQSDAAARAAITAHAITLYKRSVDGLTGLRRTQVEKRIADAVAGPKLPRAKAKPPKPVELLSAMTGKAMVVDRAGVAIKSGDSIATVESFKPPVAFRMIVSPQGNDFRVKYAANDIIFNWAQNPTELRIDGGPASGKHKPQAGAVPIKTWSTVDLVVRAKSMTISVNGKDRHSVEADFSLVDQPFSLTAYGAPVLVRSVQMIKLPETDAESSAVRGATSKSTEPQPAEPKELSDPSAKREAPGDAAGDGNWVELTANFADFEKHWLEESRDKRGTFNYDPKTKTVSIDAPYDLGGFSYDSRWEEVAFEIDAGGRPLSKFDVRLNDITLKLGPALESRKGPVVVVLRFDANDKLLAALIDGHVVSQATVIRNDPIQSKMKLTLHSGDDTKIALRDVRVKVPK